MRGHYEESLFHLLLLFLLPLLLFYLPLVAEPFLPPCCRTQLLSALHCLGFCHSYPSPRSMRRGGAGAGGGAGGCGDGGEHQGKGHAQEEGLGKQQQAQMQVQVQEE